jgi:hypothetical protein
LNNWLNHFSELRRPVEDQTGAICSSSAPTGKANSLVLRMNKNFMTWVRAKYGHELVRAFGPDADKPAKGMSLDAQS